MAEKTVKMSPNAASSRDRFSVILASASPRRQQMLAELGIPFDVFVPSFPETWTASADPAKVAKDLAEQKVRECPRKEALVIGMDTIVVIGKSKLAKPGDATEAAEMLRKLSGRAHRVISGAAVSYRQRIYSDFEETKVYFRRLTQEEISWYIATKEPFDKAGGYAIQGFGRIFIKRIDGCYYNVVGFPLSCFQRLLRRFGLTILDLQKAKRELLR